MFLEINNTEKEILSQDIIVNSQRKKDRCLIKICKDVQLL